MSAAVSIIDATPPLRVCEPDGTFRFSHLKKLALSGRQYLAAVNGKDDPNAAMLLGTLVHFLVLGVQREGAKPLVRFKGDARRGKAWDELKAQYTDENDELTAEILTAPEWAKGERIAEALMRDPVAKARLDGARREVPLTWEEDGLKLSTSGVDLITLPQDVGDLKTTTTTHPETWTRHAFRMLYPQQVALYMRGARANGIKVTGGFILGVETREPFEVVDLELSDAMLDFADRTVNLWLSKLRTYLEACPEPRTYAEWPGYAQAPVPFDVPAWMQGDGDDEEGEEVES